MKVVVFTVPVITSAQGANVTLFGSVQAEYSTVHREGQSSETLIGDNTNRSRFGLYAHENLNTNFSVKALLEYGFDIGSRSNGARAYWVALASDKWGEIKFGRVQSPFKDFSGGMTIDPFAYTTLQAAGSGGTMTASANGFGAGAMGFVNSAARYDSPRIKGFSFAALLMPGDANRLDPTNFIAPHGGFSGSQTNSGGEDGEWDFQIAGKYDARFRGHNFAVFGAYSRDNISTRQRIVQNLINNEHIWRGGASWSWKNFRLNGQYENINNAVGAATCTNQAALGNSVTGILDSRGQCNSAMNPGGDGGLWFAGAQYDWGNTSMIAQGGMSHAQATALSEKRDTSQFTVGAIHHLSNRSSLFGGYQRVMKESGESNLFRDMNIWSVGLRHNF